MPRNLAGKARGALGLGLALLGGNLAWRGTWNTLVAPQEPPATLQEEGTSSTHLWKLTMRFPYQLVGQKASLSQRKEGEPKLSLCKQEWSVNIPSALL